jgi:hypothetical protein
MQLLGAPLGYVSSHIKRIDSLTLSPVLPIRSYGLKRQVVNTAGTAKGADADSSPSPSPKEANTTDSAEVPENDDVAKTKA